MALCAKTTAHGPALHLNYQPSLKCKAFVDTGQEMVYDKTAIGTGIGMVHMFSILKFRVPACTVTSPQSMLQLHQPCLPQDRLPWAVCLQLASESLGCGSISAPSAQTPLETGSLPCLPQTCS